MKISLNREDRVVKYGLRFNYIRERIPYPYWLFYDVIVGLGFGWGYVDISHWFIIGFVFLGIAVFFDIVESIVKFVWWKERKAQDEKKRIR